MILLAESGSTKTEWCLVDRSGIVEHFLSDGINPFFQTRKEIRRSIRLQLPPIFFKTKFHTIHFYGAGCSSLEAQFKTPSIIESDLLGSARSLFKNEAGIACILGTGSNSCLYDGDTIIKNVKPLGYILGDEGSGASLGKIFLADCLKGLAPTELIEPFYRKYKIDPDEIMDYIYSKPFPNKLLSVLSFFLYEYLEHPYINNLVRKNLRSFFERNILQYEYTEYPIRFVGSIAKMYSFILREIAQDLGIYIDVIIENPIKGLIEYHKENGQLI